MNTLTSFCIAFIGVLAQITQVPDPIRVTTRLVEVNVVVRDKNGPVIGLTREDFTLRDRGRVQKVATFETHSSRISLPPISLPASEFTNRPYSDAESSQRAIVIVWDRLNSLFEDAVSGRRQVLQALSQIQAGDRVGLYTLDRNLHVIQDFTDDSAALVEALRKYRESIMSNSLDTIGERLPFTGDSAAPTRDGLIPMNTGMAHLTEMQDMFSVGISAAYRARVTAMAVRAIAGHLSSVRGRKSAIWIAGEFPGAAAALAYSGVTVYPVDLAGVISPSDRRRDTRPVPDRTLFERTVARNSGGIAFVDNDVRGAIDQAMKDSTVSYTLGFYPDRAPDRVNPLKIEVNRKGVEAGYSNAYSGIVKSDPGTGIEDALASPLDATQISLNVRLQKQFGGWNLSLKIDPAEITLPNRKGGLYIALRQIAADGTVLATTRRTIDLDFDEARYLAYLSNQHVLTLTVPNPPPSLATLRLVVGDRVSGRVGSISVSVGKQ